MKNVMITKNSFKSFKPKPNLVSLNKIPPFVKFKKTIGPKSRLKLVNRKLSYVIGSQLRSEDYLYHFRSKERLLYSVMTAHQHTFMHFAQLCRLHVQKLLTLQDPDLIYIVAHLKYIQFYFRNEFYTFLFSKFPSFFKIFLDLFLNKKKQHDFFFKKKISLRDSLMTYKLFLKKKKTFFFVLMHTKFYFIVCRTLQFFFSSYVKSIIYNFYHAKPNLCWSFFLDQNFLSLVNLVSWEESKVANMRTLELLENTNTFSIFSQVFLQEVERKIPTEFHIDTKKIYKIKASFDLPEFNFQKNEDVSSDSLEELYKKQFTFREFVTNYFKFIYSIISKKNKTKTFYGMIPVDRPPHFEFIGTLSRFFLLKEPEKKGYDFEKFTTIIPTAPLFGGTLNAINFDKRLLRTFYKSLNKTPDVLLEDPHSIDFYRIPFGTKLHNGWTVAEESIFTLDNFNKLSFTWCFFRQGWKKHKNYWRFENEFKFWNFKYATFAEESLMFFFGKNYSYKVDYMLPHIGRAVKHYSHLLNIEFTNNKYLEEVFDHLPAWVNYVEKRWYLIIEALDNKKSSKFFLWLKHTKKSKAYKAATLIKPLFPRIKSIPKYSKYFYTYYYPIFDLFQTTVLPNTSFRLPHFKREILVKKDFAHNFHIQSFLRFARVLIRKGFKQRALRMLKYCLIHIKKKYTCYSSSNLLLGAVKKATPDLVTMPFKKGKTKEDSIIPARTLRRFAAGIRTLYDCARFRRVHLDWGLDFFVGKKFEHVLAEEIIDVFKDKFDSTTLRRIRSNIIKITELRRSRYTRRFGVHTQTPYDFFDQRLKQIFSRKKKLDRLDLDVHKIKKERVQTEGIDVDPVVFLKEKKKLNPNLFNFVDYTKNFYKKQYGFAKTQQFKKNKFFSQTQNKHKARSWPRKYR